MESPIENPMNAAHNHAANAEEHTNNGLIVLAMEEHFKAAKAFTAAVERSHDESAKRTLRMLYNEQLKAGRDIQRRIEKLKDEGKDPSQPQPTNNTHAPTPTNLQPKNIVASPRTMNSPLQIPGRVESPQPLQRMTDTVDESFMLLGGQRSEPGDPFNQFWNIMQGMLDTLSSPVAFATAPLGIPEASPDAQNSSPNGSAHLRSRTPPTAGSLQRISSFSGDAEGDEPILARLGRRIGMAKESIPGIRHGYSQKSSQIKGLSDDGEEFDESLFDTGDDLSESFLVISSGSEPGALRKENAALKAELANMQRRLDTADKVIQLRGKQDQQLRDSIYQARREAQRAMGASRLGPDLANLNLNVPPPVPIPALTTGRENQYLQRIKELENEVRQCRVENEKNQAMIKKYRERWEKLKESAKRKKEAKAAAVAATSPVRERIVEEPEEEEELDNTT